MPAAEADLDAGSSLSDTPTRLPFPPVTVSHILNCSYHNWYTKFRSISPKTRLIPLPPAFVQYLRADGIILPPDDLETHPSSSESDDSRDSAQSDDEEEPVDQSQLWAETHAEIKVNIVELGGSVMPKLNWSAPKDATWISATNSMECRSPNDIYLLLKSSDFVTHDLEHAFDGCVDRNISDRDRDIPFHLVLRKTVPAFNPSVEFRCFVRDRMLLCISQREPNYFDFLRPLASKFREMIQSFFELNLEKTFSDPNFTFDVYIPTPYDRVWLLDINPWAQRTDPLLFSWLEILQMPSAEDDELDDGSSADSPSQTHSATEENGAESEASFESVEASSVELRLVNRDDPEAYSFSTPQYSAHKLPKDVVDASLDGGAGLRDFMGRWKEIVDKGNAGEQAVPQD